MNNNRNPQKKISKLKLRKLQKEADKTTALRKELQVLTESLRDILKEINRVYNG